MDLKTIKIKKKYRTSNNDDSLNSFYIPCLKNSVDYKRKAGYFSSSIFQIAEKGFKDFFKNGGKIKLLVSHLFVKEDQEILENNPDLYIEEVGNEYKKIFQQYIQNEISPGKLKIFATLLANKKIEIKIHFKPAEKGAYHAKVGIFKDKYDQRVMFSGGINESYNAWHNMSDEIMTHCSWKGADPMETIEEEEGDFKKIWENDHKNRDWKTYDFPRAIEENILEFSSEYNLDKLFENEKSNGVQNSPENYFKNELDKFILQAQTSNQTTKDYPKNLEEFSVSVSFGVGNLARIPWIAFLANSMKVTKGYYPVYLFYKEKNILILSYGVSETNKFDSDWNESVRETSKLLKEEFSEIPRYDNSYLYKYYHVSVDNNAVSYSHLPNEQPINTDLIDMHLKHILGVYRNSLQTDSSYQNSLKNINNEVINMFPHKLHSHQKEALESWRINNNQAIFKHVTGSGKTVIAIHAIEEMLKAGKKCLIVVPSNALLVQWENEIRNILRNVQVAISSLTLWKTSLEKSKPEVEGNIIFITTLQTARLQHFLGNFHAGEHVFLVVDECHSLWAKESNKVLSEMNWGNCPRMALSATPDDKTFSDNIISEDKKDELTQVMGLDGESILIGENSDEILEGKELTKDELGKVNVIDFFKGNSKEQGEDKFTHSLTIKDAINAIPPILAKYWYYFRKVYLNEEETAEFIEKSRKIAAYMGDPEKKDELKKQLILRQQIINIARNKRDMVEKLLDKEQNKDDDSHNLLKQKWVVYVGAGRTDKYGEKYDKANAKSEIDWVKDHIDNGLNSEKRFYTYKYDGSLKKAKNNRKKILDDFDRTKGVIFACKMLDEGVDIPQLSRAIIMASSGNDREFIQRRGRVLRINRSGHGDAVSRIWDLIVLPLKSKIDDKDKITGSMKNLIRKEIGRLRIFAEDAENKIEMLDNIKDMEDEWGLNDE